MLAAVAQSPQLEVGQAAAQYLSKQPSGPAIGLAETKRWSLGAEAGFEYDSNVVLAPNDETIKSTRDISDEADGRFKVEVGGRYRIMAGEQASISLGYDFSQSTHFSLTEFDLQGHEFRADFSVPWRGIELGLTGGYDFYALNYRSYLQQGTGMPWLTFFESDWGATNLYYRFRGYDYLRAPFEPYLDAFNHAFGVRQYYWIPGGNGVLNAGYQLDYDDPVSDDGEEFEYLGHQLELSYGVPLRDWARIRAGYLFRLEDYESVNSRTGTELYPSGTRRRHDNQHQLAFDVRRNLTEHWSAAFFYVAVLNGSNIDPFEYDRHIVALHLRYDF